MLAGLVGVLTAVSVVAAPQASAAGCVYNRVDLPLPAGVTSAHTEGSSANNSRIVGAYRDPNVTKAALWVNSTLRVLPPAVSPFYDVFPEDVNNTSVVVGSQEWRASDRTATQAFRFENNAYQFLYTALDENSRGQYVNEAGDVVGTVWKRANPTERTVVMWPREGGRRSFGLGQASGLSGRKIVKYDEANSKSLIVDADTGATVELPGGRPPAVVDGGRVLTYRWVDQVVGGEIAEWDLNGVEVAIHRGGYQPYGRNNSGTVFGVLEPMLGSTPSLWRPSGRTAVVADKLPIAHYYGDVTDAATLIGTYNGEADQLRPARWLWVCS
ncbi:hypothetical protein Lesp01_11590 [Lentzea sp. NBRC 102530]|nr:hypothetical protein Lesp01_11590 [Lentzea sp. NBRC 102530]